MIGYKQRKIVTVKTAFLNVPCNYLSNRAFPRFRVFTEDIPVVCLTAYLRELSLREFLTFSANTNYY